MKETPYTSRILSPIAAALWAALSCANAAGAEGPAQICAGAAEMRPAFGSPERREVKIESESLPAWAFSGKNGEAVSAVFIKMPGGYRGAKIEIVVAALEKPGGESSEAVYRATLSQTDPKTKKEINRLKCVPARLKIPNRPFEAKTVELESCYPAIPGLPVNARIERLTGDPSDTFEAPVALLAAKMAPVSDLPAPENVETAKGYNSWPMMQALGGKLVCVYSRGSAHTIGEGARGAYARVSGDGGKTWSEETLVSNDPAFGEVPIGKGLDENGDALFWIRFVGKGRVEHRLYRTKDGRNFELVCSPKLSPTPMQITDVFKVPTAGLMAIWFTGNYGKDALNAWGTLVSRDNGRTWIQKTAESGLDRKNWNTEQSAAYIGGGRILAIARIEHDADSTERAQFQLESRDYGKTWTRERTNIGDVFISTPSLVYDEKTGLVSNYYYQRARYAKAQGCAGGQRFRKSARLAEPRNSGFCERSRLRRGQCERHRHRRHPLSCVLFWRQQKRVGGGILREGAGKGGSGKVECGSGSKSARTFAEKSAFGFGREYCGAKNGKILLRRSRQYKREIANLRSME